MAGKPKVTIRQCDCCGCETEHDYMLSKNDCDIWKCIACGTVVIRHDQNQGVGGAVITGYQAAIRDDMKIIVKIDGDGQMDPMLIPEFVLPIIEKEADYTKGKRFFDLETVKSMPRARCSD